MCACVHACWDWAEERCYFCSLPRKHAGTQCDRQHHTNNNEVAVLPTRRNPNLPFPLPVSPAGWDRTGWGQRWGRPLPQGELQSQHGPFWVPPGLHLPLPGGCRHSQAPKNPQVGGQQRGREPVPPPAALPQCHPGAQTPVLSVCWDTGPVPVPTRVPGTGGAGTPPPAAPAPGSPCLGLGRPKCSWSCHPRGGQQRTASLKAGRHPLRLRVLGRDNPRALRRPGKGPGKAQKDHGPQSAPGLPPRAPRLVLGSPLQYFPCSLQDYKLDF